MIAILVTSPEAAADLRRRVGVEALADLCRVLVQPPDAVLEAEVSALLHGWDSQRDAWRAATRKNDPFGFGRRLVRGERGGRQSCAVVLAGDAGIRAVLTGVIETRRAWHRLGVLHLPSFRSTAMTVDYSGFISDGKPQTLERAGRFVTDFVRLGAVDAMHLRYVEAGSDWHRVVRDQARRRLLRFEVPSTHWIAQLVDSETGKRIEHGSGKTRHTHRRKDKKLDSHFGGDVAVEVVTARSQVDEFIRVAADIFQRTWHSSFGSGIHAGSRDYLCELADDGVLRAYVLRAGGRAIAYVMGDLQQGTYYLWDTAFLPEHAQLSPGTYLFRRALEELAGMGVARFDFGWGDFDYKRVLGAREVEDRDVHLYARRLIPSLAWAIGALVSRTEIRLKQLAKEHDLKNAAHRAWRRVKASLPGRRGPPAPE